MKRLIGILVLAAVVVTMIVVAGAEETDKKIVFTSNKTEVAVNDIITVTLSLENFEDCDTLMFYDPQYNEEALEWVGGEWLVEGLMSDYITVSSLNNGIEQGCSGVFYSEDMITMGSGLVTFEFKVLKETGAEEISFSVIAKNADTVLSENAQVTAAKVMLGKKVEINYDLQQTIQLGLIEPWFIQTNLYVVDPETNKDLTTNQLEDLIDFGVYYIRASELDDTEMDISNITVDDIINDTDAVKCEKTDGSAWIYNGRIRSKYEKGIYTYELSDSIYVLYYIETENGILYDDILERNFLTLASARMNDAVNFPNALERDVYAKMVNMESMITTYRSDFTNPSPLPEADAPVIGEHEISGNIEQISSFVQHTAQIVLIEPWGLKFNGYIQSSDTYDEYGVVVYYDLRNELSDPALEELLTLENARVFSSTNGDVEVGNLSVYQGNTERKVSAIYNTGLHTYQLNTNAYFAFYVRKGEDYTFGPVKKYNIYDLANIRKDDEVNFPNKKERDVYDAMIKMYTAVKTYQDWYRAQ